MLGVFRKTMARFEIERGLIDRVQFRSCGVMHAIAIETRKRIEGSRDLIRRVDEILKRETHLTARPKTKVAEPDLTKETAKVAEAAQIKDGKPR